jgi:lysophospholipid acyltransferase (LPLAT)-like uncharacterized protein
MAVARAEAREAASGKRQASLGLAMLAWAAAVFVRLLGHTWRSRVSHDGDVHRLRADRQPIVFTIWHGEMLPLLYQHRRQGVAVLISEHGDGEIIAQIAERLGYRTVRGSTSRGAARAILELARVVGEGHDLAITPDGPRGPNRSVAPGALVVAHRTGAPLIGAVAVASSAWRLRSWDRFMIPRPFARVAFGYSDPSALETTAQGARGAAEEVDRLAAAMALAEERARRALTNG